MEIRQIFFKILGFNLNYCDYNDTDGLYVSFTNRCPNHCRFCIEKNRDRSWLNISGKRLAEKTNGTGRTALKLAGAEPCVDIRRLYDYVANLNDNIKITYLATSLPKACLDDYGLFEKVVSRCDTVSVSAHGISNAEDEAVFNNKLGYDKQKLIAKLAGDYRDKICVSRVLAKSQTSNFRDLLEYVGHYYGLGVRRIYLNEMASGSNLFGHDPEFVSISDIFENSGMKRLGSPYSNGCSVDLTGYFEGRFPGIRVTCRRRCFKCGGGDEVSVKDIVKAALNRILFRKQATPILNNNGLITDRYPAKRQRE